MANGEIVAVGILGAIVSIIYFSFYLVVNLGKEIEHMERDNIVATDYLYSHYPLRYFFLFFGIFMMYILMWQGLSFGLTFVGTVEEPFYSLVELLTFFWAYFMVAYFFLYFLIMLLDRIGALAKIKHRWRIK